MKIFITALVAFLVYVFGGIAMESYGITTPSTYAFFGYVIGFIYAAVLALIMTKTVDERR